MFNEMYEYCTSHSLSLYRHTVTEHGDSGRYGYKYLLEYWFTDEQDALLFKLKYQ